MKTKKVMAVIALLMAGMFVSAQSYISPDEALRLEKEMRDADRPETTTKPLGFDLYDVFWDIYFGSPVNVVHPTSQAYGLSDSNDKLFDYQRRMCKRCPKSSGGNRNIPGDYDYINLPPKPNPMYQPASYSNSKAF